MHKIFLTLLLFLVFVNSHSYYNIPIQLVKMDRSYVDDHYYGLYFNFRNNMTDCCSSSQINKIYILDTIIILREILLDDFVSIINMIKYKMEINGIGANFVCQGYCSYSGCYDKRSELYLKYILYLSPYTEDNMELLKKITRRSICEYLDLSIKCY